MGSPEHKRKYRMSSHPNVSGGAQKGPTSNINRVSKFVPISNSQSTNTKINRTINTDSHQYKRQSTLNYYGDVKNENRRKTAVEKARDIHQKYENKSKETWKVCIHKALGFEEKVENSSCCVCTIICILVVTLLCVGIPIVYFTLSSTLEVQQETNESFWANQTQINNSNGTSK